MDEPGRRASDRNIDPEVEMYVQEAVRETRHSLRSDIAVLAAEQAKSALQATKEHGEVRSEIQDVRAELSALRRDVSQLLPLKDSVFELKRRDDIDAARTEAIDRLRVQQRKTQYTMVGIVLAGVPAISLLLSHIH